MNALKNFALFLIFLFFLQCGIPPDPLHYVNPFIGTRGGGHTFPGPSLPFGMVKLSPDCDFKEIA